MTADYNGVTVVYVPLQVRNHTLALIGPRGTPAKERTRRKRRCRL